MEQELKSGSLGLFTVPDSRRVHPSISNMKSQSLLALWLSCALLIYCPPPSPGCQKTHLSLQAIKNNGKRSRSYVSFYHPDLDFTGLLTFIPEQLTHSWDCKVTWGGEIQKMETAVQILPVFTERVAMPKQASPSPASEKLQVPETRGQDYSVRWGCTHPSSPRLAEGTEILLPLHTFPSTLIKSRFSAGSSGLWKAGQTVSESKPQTWLSDALRFCHSPLYPSSVFITCCVIQKKLIHH